jgi:hypothetical protein
VVVDRLQCQHHRSWGGASTRRRGSDTPSTQPVPAQAPASCPLTRQARATASTGPPNSGGANAAAHQPERRKPDAGPLHSFASPRMSQLWDGGRLAHRADMVRDGYVVAGFPVSHARRPRRMSGCAAGVLSPVPRRARSGIATA